MPLAEGVSARIAYKFYTDQKIIPGIPAISATDPGPTGAQILRRVASTLAFTKDTYQSNEIRSDYQIADFRHGVRRVAGNVSGELSPLTYAQLFQASLRSVWTPAVSSSNTTLTSMTADHTASTLVFGGGDPVVAGLKAGMGIKFTGLTTTANNNTTFMITGFSGTNNRTVAVLPAPTTAASEATFSVSSTGSPIIISFTVLLAAKTALAGSRRPEEREPFLLLVGTIGLLGSLEAVHSTFTLFRARVDDPFAGDPFVVAVVTVSLLSSAGWTLGVITLVNARLSLQMGQAVAEMQRSEHAAHAARDEAVKAGRAKEEFLSSVTHELRTPLNAMAG